MTDASDKQIGVLWRAERDALLAESRYKPVGEALARERLKVVGVPYTDRAAGQVHNQLLGLDGVLVWVDPIAGGQDRSVLDPILHDVAAQGVWVSTHPAVVLKMGTKDVLVTTRHLAWGSDCYLYRTAEQLADGLALRLPAGPRVLKQHRGNGGNGVWKLTALDRGPIDRSSRVQVLHAQRESALEEMDLQQFITRCGPYFAGTGCLIDQPYQARLADGMIRCYLVGNQVAGFGHQFVTALLPPPEGSTRSEAPPPRYYYGPEKPEFQAVRVLLEGGWIKDMQAELDIGDEELPALWDADFLYGPEDGAGADSYVLCEINASCVSPFPDEALAPLAATAAHRLAARA